MTVAEVRQRFFEDPIVVQFGQDARSQKTRDWIDREIGGISGAKIVFVKIEEQFPLGAKVLHKGDVITGKRLGYFLSYARKLGAF